MSLLEREMLVDEDGPVGYFEPWPVHIANHHPLPSTPGHQLLC